MKVVERLWPTWQPGRSFMFVTRHTCRDKLQRVTQKQPRDHYVTDREVEVCQQRRPFRQRGRNKENKAKQRKEESADEEDRVIRWRKK